MRRRLFTSHSRHTVVVGDHLGEAQRYAAFRTQPDDTPQSLKRRVLAYYAQLLVDRARPPEIRSGWAQRRNVKKPAETVDAAE